MMNREYNILIFGIIQSVFLQNFVKSLKKENPFVHIFYWGIKDSTTECLDDNFLSCFDDYLLFETNNRFSKIPIFKKILTLYTYRRAFKNFVSTKKIDIVQIHFVKYIYSFLLDIIKRKGAKLVLTPWGSDVFFQGRPAVFLIRILYAAADFVTGKKGTLFTDRCLFKFRFSEKKLVPVFLGVDTIDYILENLDNLNTNDAKKSFGLENSYVITCGYKAEPGQQHLKIIEAINNVKHNLPQNLLLVFPFTYGGTLEYRQSVKDKIKEYNLNSLFIEDFLDLNRLMLLRQATDMYIHVLEIDNASASIREYLLCGKKIIKGAWLGYEELEQSDYKPYFEVDSMKNLGNAIINAYNSDNIPLSPATYKALEERGWKQSIKKWDSFYKNIL